MGDTDRDYLDPVKREGLVELYRLKADRRFFRVRKLCEIGPDQVVEDVLLDLIHNSFSRIDRK